MKIDKSLQSVTTVSLAEGKKRTDVNSAGSDLPQVNNVHLSPNATKLQNIDSNLASGSVVNSARIQEIKQAIANLKKGELIIKNQTAATLGMGKRFKIIKTNHLI